MAKVQLGSKHGRPALEVTATLSAHPKVDNKRATEAGFFANGNKAAFTWSRWVPMPIAGKTLTKEEAVKSFATWLDALEAVEKSEGVIVKNASGETLFDGKISAMPGRTTFKDGSIESAGSYGLGMIQYAYSLAHQNEMRAEHSDEVVEAARAKGLLKPEGAKGGSGRASRDARMV